MLKTIKERATTILVIIAGVWILWVVAVPLLNTQGGVAASTAGAGDFWGYAWASQNIGWLFLVVFVLVAFGYIGYTIHRGKRG
jgi:hypothetical protein